LPLAIGKSGVQQEIITLVDSILAAKCANPKANTSKLEEEIDKLVYKLYGLTQEEIDIVEERS
jgi:type II restriction/modification system DNA methylase subunit YeeA